METNILLPIERIEPPFWYAGMHHTDLQILFYGKNIAHYWVTTSNTIAIKAVEKTENPNYLFVTIDTKNVPPTDFIFVFKKKNKVAFSKKYTLKQRKENSAERKSFDSSDVMYLLMPDRFSNGNGENNNDRTTTEKYNRSLPEGRHGGDIQGIINHLEYIQELGATAIWCTPLCEDNDAVCSYHTYAQSDVYKIDPRYGTNEDYVRLSKEIHKKNMKLVMDYIVNHWGLEHWMMNDLPTPDWMNQFENYTQTNHKRSLIHDIYASKIDTKECFDGWFVPTMPDLNQRNPLVLQYLIQNAIWWIEYADLDGFRVDTYNYAEPDAIAKWTKAITDEYPNFNIVGEISMRQQAQLSFWQKDSAIGKIQNFNSNLPSVMDFILSDDLLNILNEDEGTWGRGMMRIYDNLANDFLYPNSNNILIFAENHDTHRLNQNYSNDIRKYKMAMVILATLRGIPQLYYGSEVGMNGNKDKGDAFVRADFPGGWITDSNNAFTKEGRTAMQNEYFDFTCQLFQWRKTKSVVHFGKLTHYIPENNCYVYFRHNETESVMVIFNNSSQTQNIKLDRFQENIGNYKSGKDVITKLKFDLSNEIKLETKSVLILELSQLPIKKILSNE